MLHLLQQNTHTACPDDTLQMVTVLLSFKYIMLYVAVLLSVYNLCMSQCQYIICCMSQCQHIICCVSVYNLLYVSVIHLLSVYNLCMLQCYCQNIICCMSHCYCQYIICCMSVLLSVYNLCMSQCYCHNIICCMSQCYCQYIFIYNRTHRHSASNIPPLTLLQEVQIKK